MKRLYEDIKTFKGNVVCIGIENNKIIRELNKNNNVEVYELNRVESKHALSKRKKFTYKKGKTVKIKKFRKIFKKKSINYMIIDLDSVVDYYKYIASNSIYTCCNKIYIYGNTEYIDAQDVSKKYKRYKTSIESIQVDDKYLVIVDTSKAKYRRLKEKFYILIDTLHNVGDMVSYFLTS